MSIVGYARVSTIGQALEVQLEQLHDAGCERVFSEKQSGSSTEKRNELKAALEYVREGDVLVVTRLDRLARSVVDLKVIIDRLEAKGIGFRCIQQNFETHTPEGRLMLNILASFAEFEMDLRRSRQMEGIVKAKEAGKYTRKRILKVEPEEVLALKAQDFGPAQIAKKLKISRATVYRLTPGIWGAPVIPKVEEMGD